MAGACAFTLSSMRELSVRTALRSCDKPTSSDAVAASPSCSKVRRTARVTAFEEWASQGTSNAAPRSRRAASTPLFSFSNSPNASATTNAKLAEGRLTLVKFSKASKASAPHRFKAATAVCRSTPPSSMRAMNCCSNSSSASAGTMSTARCS